MALMDFLKNKLKKDEDFKAAEKEVKIQKIIEQRQKGSNERELERFVEEDRQRTIKEQLEQFRNKEKEKMRTNIFKGKNIFKGHKSILHQDDKMFDLKMQNQGNMFFK